MSVKTLSRFIVAFVVVLGLTGAAGVYRYSRAPTLQLVVEASHQGAPAPLRWAALKALLHLHPSDEEIAELNRQAGARYLAEIPDKDAARAVLRGYQARGLDLDSRDQESGAGLTALQVVAIANEPEKVALLLESGADAQATDGRGRTALVLVKMSQRNRSDVDFSQVVALLEHAVDRR